MRKKIVKFLIEVPDSDYCFDGRCACSYFNNSNSFTTCDLGFYPITYNNKSGCYTKPEECKKLEEKNK